jgi:hypothetical protein
MKEYLERIGERVVFSKTTERAATSVLIFAIAFFLLRVGAALMEAIR